MSSTRNKNNRGNFELEFNGNKSYFHKVVDGSRIYKTSYLPGEGLLGGSYPSNIMANNQVDIETSLFGINSTNLVDPKENTINLNDFKLLKSLNVCNKQHLVMPKPFIGEYTYKY
jgi:hypothetical protein